MREKRLSKEIHQFYAHYRIAEIKMRNNKNSFECAKGQGEVKEKLN